MKLAILVPTLNAGDSWIEFLEAIDHQTINVDKKIILDSGSTDSTVDLAKQYKFEVIEINKAEFNHGYARQLLAVAAKHCDILIYLTQDAIIVHNKVIQNLISAFKDHEVGISYGRQIPHKNAKILESHARYFNYPNESIVKKLEDKGKMGIKTASCSNSFAAYNRLALASVGGFPTDSIFGEDVIVGGKMLMKNWKISYVANAEVYHSHDYTVIEEFKRYFDIGVFHSSNSWLLDNFGKADGEGFKYVKSELLYVLRRNPLLLFKMSLSTIAKLVGYKLGLRHMELSKDINKRFSMYGRYWDSK